MEHNHNESSRKIKGGKTKNKDHLVKVEKEKPKNGLSLIPFIKNMFTPSDEKSATDTVSRQSVEHLGEQPQESEFKEQQFQEEEN